MEDPETVVAQQQQVEDRCRSDPLGVDPPERLPTEEDLSARADPLGLPVSRLVLPGQRWSGKPTPKTPLPVTAATLLPATICRLLPTTLLPALSFRPTA